jgi:hypothetical protein
MNYKRLFFYVLLILTFVMFAGFAKAVSINEAVLYGQENSNINAVLSNYQPEDKVSLFDTVTLLCRAHNVMNDTSYVLKYDENSVFNYALENGIEPNLSIFSSDFTPEEMSHLASVAQKQEGPASETAFKDCIAIIRAEAQRKSVSSDDDLLALRNKLKERKGTK